MKMYSLHTKTDNTLFDTFGPLLSFCVFRSTTKKHHKLFRGPFSEHSYKA